MYFAVFRVVYLDPQAPEESSDCFSARLCSPPELLVGRDDLECFRRDRTAARTAQLESDGEVDFEQANTAENGAPRRPDSSETDSQLGRSLRLHRDRAVLFGVNTRRKAHRR